MVTEFKLACSWVASRHAQSIHLKHSDVHYEEKEASESLFKKHMSDITRGLSCPVLLILLKFIYLFLALFGKQLTNFKDVFLCRKCCIFLLLPTHSHT